MTRVFYDDRLRDVGSVVVPNGIVLAAVNLSQVNVLVSITAALVTTAYALWRWRRDIKKGS